MLGKENISYGQNIFVCMNNIMDKKKAEKLDSTSIARCFCFKCRIKNLLKGILIGCHDQVSLLFINVNNFNDDNDSVTF